MRLPAIFTPMLCYECHMLPFAARHCYFAVYYFIATLRHADMPAFDVLQYFPAQNMRRVTLRARLSRVYYMFICAMRLCCCFDCCSAADMPPPLYAIMFHDVRYYTPDVLLCYVDADAPLRLRDVVLCHVLTACCWYGAPLRRRHVMPPYSAMLMLLAYVFCALLSILFFFMFPPLRLPRYLRDAACCSVLLFIRLLWCYAKMPRRLFCRFDIRCYMLLFYVYAYAMLTCFWWFAWYDSCLRVERYAYAPGAALPCSVATLLIDVNFAVELFRWRVMLCPSSAALIARLLRWCYVAPLHVVLMPPLLMMPCLLVDFHDVEVSYAARRYAFAFCSYLRYDMRQTMPSPDILRWFSPCFVLSFARRAYKSQSIRYGASSRRRHALCACSSRLCRWCCRQRLLRARRRALVYATAQAARYVLLCRYLPCYCCAMRGACLFFRDIYAAVLRYGKMRYTAREAQSRLIMLI